jgi:hypothetical protein
MYIYSFRYVYLLETQTHHRRHLTQQSKWNKKPVMYHILLLHAFPTTPISRQHHEQGFQRCYEEGCRGQCYTKFTQPKVARGKTAFPSAPQLQKQLGVRYDYDGEVEKDGVKCHKYQLQPNAGSEIPSSIQRWREKNGGTHAVMASVYVKKMAARRMLERLWKRPTTV